MFRSWKAPLVAVIALGTCFASVPAARAAVVVARPRVVFRPGLYARAWYPRFGFGWGWGWGPAWYGRAWGPGWWWGGPGYYYYGPRAGHVKIVTPDKSASVFVDGGYIGTVGHVKKFPLRPGNHEVQLRDPNGHTFYRQEVRVLPGKTVDIHPSPAG